MTWIVYECEKKHQRWCSSDDDFSIFPKSPLSGNFSPLEIKTAEQRMSGYPINPNEKDKQKFYMNSSQLDGSGYINVETIWMLLN